MDFKVHHVAFTVRSIDESIAWYQEKLGFVLVIRYGAHGMELAHLKRGNVRIELFGYTAGVTSLPDYRKNLMMDLHVVGTKHLCIEVENLEETIREFREKGVEFVMEIDTAGFGGRYVFLKDCNGILIELYQV